MVAPSIQRCQGGSQQELSHCAAAVHAGSREPTCTPTAGKRTGTAGSRVPDALEQSGSPRDDGHQRVPRRPVRGQPRLPPLASRRRPHRLHQSSAPSGTPRTFAEGEQAGARAHVGHLHTQPRREPPHASSASSVLTERARAPGWGLHAGVPGDWERLQNSALQSWHRAGGRHPMPSEEPGARPAQGDAREPAGPQAAMGAGRQPVPLTPEPEPGPEAPGFT